MELSGWVAPDQGDETEPNEKGIGQANGQRRAVAEPPGTARTTSGLGRQVLANAQATQRRKAPATTLPLTPDGGTKPTPYPLVEAAQHRGGLAEPEVAPPSNEVARQLRNKTRETDALRAARQLPNPRLESCQRLRRKAQLGTSPNREAETQKKLRLAGRATALLAVFTRSLRRRARKPVTLAITRSPARLDRT